jgi:hypothetical protein
VEAKHDFHIGIHEEPTPGFRHPQQQQPSITGMDTPPVHFVLVIFGAGGASQNVQGSARPGSVQCHSRTHIQSLAIEFLY